MSARNVVFANGEYYHIFNRGVARQPIFYSSRDYERFLLSIQFYRYENISIRLSRLLQLPTDERKEILSNLKIHGNYKVELLCFCLMPNHFHFLLRQVNDNGITTFMSKFTNSYTRYFNVKRKRVGDLFQGVFKAVRVETDEQLLHLSRYIHLNPLVSYVVKEKEFFNYPWSSMGDYINGKSDLVNAEILLAEFKSGNKYKKFVFDRADYAKRLEEIKHLVIEK